MYFPSQCGPRLLYIWWRESSISHCRTNRSLWSHSNGRSTQLPTFRLPVPFLLLMSYKRHLFTGTTGVHARWHRSVPVATALISAQNSTFSVPQGWIWILRSTLQHKSHTSQACRCSSEISIFITFIMNHFLPIPFKESGSYETLGGKIKCCDITVSISVIFKYSFVPKMIKHTHTL